MMTSYTSKQFKSPKKLNPTKRLLKITALAVLLGFPFSTLATVGGGQRIEVLGYEATDKKVYILRHFDDGRGRLPQLYYYDLTSKKPQQMVEVRSLYINPKTKKFDQFDDNDTFFSKRLNRIKQRVTKLKPEYESTTVNVHSLTQRKDKAESWLGELGKLIQYNFTYKVATDNGKYASALQNATAYKVCVLDSGVIYHIPNQPYAVTTVKYTGTLMEGGYEYEDAVLLKAKDKIRGK